MNGYVVHIYNGILLSHKKWNNVICSNMDGPKAMSPHSSALAWKIPWTEEPGRLQSMGSLGVRHDFTFTFHFHALEKKMATHSSVLAWKIPGMGKPGGLPSVGSHRVGHDWSDLAAAAEIIFIILSEVNRTYFWYNTISNIIWYHLYWENIF